MIITITPNPLLNYHIEDDPGHAGERRCRSFGFSVGGKGINVARMLKTLGQPALSLTFAGGDNGAKIAKQLQQECLPTRIVKTSSITRIGIDLNFSGASPHRWWLEDGEELIESEVLEFLNLLKTETKDASYLVLSGSVPGKGNRNFYQRILETARDFSGEIFIDARDEVLKNACISGGFFLKHNREEAISSFGIDPFAPGRTGEFIERLRKLRIWGAMITDGKNEVLLWDGETTFRLFPASADEVSSVGCGDATMAGLVFGRSKGMSILEACFLGLACGAADCECLKPCSAGFEDIQRKMSQINIVRNEAFGR